jgi:putative spermidine/putrescine transport system permease protein
LILFFVLLPFWTSILVRTLSWAVILQREGIVNGLLLSAGIISEPLSIMYSREAVYVSLVHILLPFMILPIYTTMKAIPIGLTRAASSLGAPPLASFLWVYLPLCAPGIAAGCLLVFIQALGAYVTPVLLGGPDDQGIAGFIGFFVLKTVNWGMAAALSILLLIGTAILFAIYVKLSGPLGNRRTV